MSGTLDRIEREKQFAVGFGALAPQDERAASDFVSRLERATGADATIERGPLERQLVRLEEGNLDLVIGEFAEDTPWAVPVAVIEPLGRRHEGKRRIHLAPVAANGENRWIALLEREVRDSAGQGGG